MVAVATPEFVETAAGVPSHADGGIAPPADPGISGGDNTAPLRDLFDPQAAAPAGDAEQDAGPADDPLQAEVAKLNADWERKVAQLQSIKDREASTARQEAEQHRAMAQVATAELGQVYTWLEGAAREAMQSGQSIVLDPAQIFDFLNTQTQSRNKQFAQHAQQQRAAQMASQTAYHMEAAVVQHWTGQMRTGLGLDEQSVGQLTAHPDYRRALAEHTRAAAAFAADQSDQHRLLGELTRERLEAVVTRLAQPLKAEQDKRRSALERSSANIDRAQKRGPQSLVTHGGGAGPQTAEELFSQLRERARKEHPDNPIAEQMRYLQLKHEALSRR